MRFDTNLDRNKVLMMIKRKPRMTIFELTRSTGRTRHSVIYHVTQLIREGRVQAVQLPARPGVSEVRNGYEIAVNAAPGTAVKNIIPPHWDVLSHFFGFAASQP